MDFVGMIRRCRKIDRCIEVDTLTSPFGELFDRVCIVFRGCFSRNLPRILTDCDTEFEWS